MFLKFYFETSTEIGEKSELFKGNLGSLRGNLIIIIEEMGTGDPSSYLGRCYLHVTKSFISLGKICNQLFSFKLWVNSRATWVP